ncbi:MAG: hypothetical protein ACWGQW_10535 [bacterium]
MMIDLVRAVAISFGSIGLVYFTVKWVRYGLALRRARKHTLTTWGGILGYSNPGERREMSWFSRAVRSAEEDIDRSLRSLQNDVTREQSYVNFTRQSMFERMKEAFRRFGHIASRGGLSAQETSEALRNLSTTATRAGGRVMSTTTDFVSTSYERPIVDAVRMFKDHNEREFREGLTDVLLTLDWEYDIRRRDFLIRLDGRHREGALDSRESIMPYTIHIPLNRIEGTLLQAAAEYVLQQILEAERFMTAFTTPSQREPEAKAPQKEIKTHQQNLHGHAVALQRYVQNNKLSNTENSCSGKR